MWILWREKSKNYIINNYEGIFLIDFHNEYISKIKKLKRNDFVVGYGDDLEGTFVSLYFQPGENVVENSGIIKRIYC